MKKILVILPICSIALSFMPGTKIKKGLQALSEYDYFKAKNIFYREMKKSSVVAAYGLATIYYRSDNPFHNLDSAAKFINISMQGIKSQGSKSKFVTNALVSDSLILSLNDSICNFGFKKLMKAISPEKSEKYLMDFTYSRYRIRVLNLRDSLVFEKLIQSPDVKSITSFIEKYPQTQLRNKAFSLLYFTLYKEITASGKDTAYERYINLYPAGKFAETARMQLLKLYEKEKKTKGIYALIRRFNNKNNMSVAWNTLLSMETRNHSPEELENFFKNYPDYPLRDEMLNDFKTWRLQLLLIRNNELFGFCDSSGQIKIKPEYQEADNFKEGYALVMKNDLYGYINKSGKVKIDFKYPEAGSFNHNVAIVQKNKSWYVIDQNNRILTDVYDDISEFSNGLAVVKKGGLFGAIDLNGKEIISSEFESLGDFSEGKSSFLKNGKYGFIDLQGFPLIPPLFDWVEDFKLGRCRVKVNNKYGVIDTIGDYIIKPDFDLIEQSRQGVYVVVKNNYYGFMDSTGCFLSEVKYNYDPSFKAASLSDGTWMTLRSDKSKILQDRNGFSCFESEEPSELSLPINGYVKVSRKNRWDLYSLRLQKFVKKKMQGISCDGRYWYFFDGKFLKVCDLVQLKEVLQTEMEDAISYLNYGWITQSQDGYGFMDEQGKEVLNPVYEKIQPSDFRGILSIEKDGKAAYFNLRTKVFIWKEMGFN